MLKKFSVKTSKRDQMIEITDQVEKFMLEQNLVNGAIIVYCPHTTSGITVNENADPDVKVDMIRRFDELFPWEHKLDRHLEGNTAAHMKASTVGSSLYIIVTDGKLLLGTWQGIYFCEFDGPRVRNYYLKIIKS